MADPADRRAYLEEQIERQKRGEPIDVEWVRSELERVRREQTDRLASSQRNLRWLVIGAAALLLVLWLRQGGFSAGGTPLVLGLIVIGLLAAFGLGRRRRN